MSCRCVYTFYLSHFFDFGASFANKGATLAGRDNEPQGYRGFTGGWTVAHGVDYILSRRRDQVLSDKYCVVDSSFWMYRGDFVEIHINECMYPASAQYKTHPRLIFNVLTQN